MKRPFYINLSGDIELSGAKVGFYNVVIESNVPENLVAELHTMCSAEAVRQLQTTKSEEEIEKLVATFRATLTR